MWKNHVLFIIMGFYMNKIVKGIALAAGTYVACGLQYHKIDQTEYSISFMLIDALKNYPVYFTSGNHDNYLNQMDELRRILQQKGVHVLEDAGAVFTKWNSAIEIFGMSDHGRKPMIQASDLKYMFHTDLYKILISHRPEYTEFYKKADCDLVVSGHVHGGQWRMPLVKRGMYAPQQGVFPAYSQGVHRLNGTNLVISRGLASGNPMIPRLYNNPEIVFIQLTNQKKNNIIAK